MRVLGVIPARGGSKGIPRKNLRPLAGKPLLVWTAEAALDAKLLSRVILSTDDESIAAVGRAAGLDVPFLRPQSLAEDETPTLPVVRHALQFLEAAGARYDAVCLLQPTSPLRRPDTIDGCIALLERESVDAVVTVLPVPTEHHPYWAFVAGADGLLRLATGATSPPARRQELPPAFHREGSVYVTRRDVVMEQGSLYGTKLLGYAVDPAGSVNLDTPAQWERAEALLRNAG